MTTPITEEPWDAAPAITSGYAPGLDGMKALGVLMMLATHSGLAWAKGGIFTISMFFTLSGFLITSLLLTELRRDGRIDLRQFWVRRARRLLPGALVILAAVVVYGLVFADPIQRSALRGDVLGSLAYVANWRFIASGHDYLDHFRTPSPVLHFWSLAIEEQFYVFFPIVALLAVKGRNGVRSFDSARRNLGIVLLVLIAASTLAGLRPGLTQDRIYLGTDTRAAELLIGAFLGVLLCRRPMGTPTTSVLARKVFWVLGPLAMAGSIAIWFLVPDNAVWIYRAGFPAYAVLTAVFLTAANDSSNPVAKILDNRPCAWLGQRTYGIYLIHFPLFLVLTPQRTGLSEYPLFALRIGITFVLATLSFRFFEKPVRYGKPLLGQPMWRWAPVLAVVVAISIIATTSRLPTTAVESVADPATFARPSNAVIDETPIVPVTPVETSTTSTTSLAAPTSSAPETTAVPARTRRSIVEALADPRPVPGGLTPRPLLMPQRPIRLMIVGDSSAVFLTYTLAGWTDHTKAFEVLSFGEMGCGLVRGGTEIAAATELGFDPRCSDWATIWRKGLAELKPDAILMASAFHEATDRRLTPDGPMEHIGQPNYDKVLLDTWREAADVLHSTGKPVLWLTAPPLREGQNLPAFNPDDSPASEPARMDLMNDLLDQLATEKPFVKVVEYAEFFLTWPGGPFDAALRPDGLHVDGEGHDNLGPWLGAELLHHYWEAV